MGHGGVGLESEICDRAVVGSRHDKARLLMNTLYILFCFILLASPDLKNEKLLGLRVL